jgi:hypothetical protein
MADATYEEKQAWLCYPFGYEFAVRYFGQARVDNMPRIQSGANEGKVKGFVRWTKCTANGTKPHSVINETRSGRMVKVELCTQPFRKPVKVLKVLDYMDRDEAVPMFGQGGNNA